MAIYSKDKAWESDSRSEKVTDEEWREIFSILVQAQKVKLFATWRDEEKAAKIRFGPEEFWLSLRQPIEGDWPPPSILSNQPDRPPFIDPDTLKLTDLPEPTVGERAIALWNARQERLKQIPKDLKAEREANGFNAMLRQALGHLNPGDALQHDLTALNNDLNSLDATVIDNATQKIEDNLHLTVEGFKRLMTIKVKNDNPDPLKKPTAVEWAEVYTILTPARKVKHEFPIWRQEEQSLGLEYWSALKAKLPRWRASLEARQEWLQALRTRNQLPIIDPDLITTGISKGELKNLVPGDPAYALWQKRDIEINEPTSGQLNTLRVANASKDLAGLNTILERTLSLTVAQFLAIAEARDKGECN
jgi:hypothetical protein